MAQIIEIGRAADIVLRHGRLTLENAATKGSLIKEDAERFLRTGVELAKALSRQLEDNAEAVDRARPCRPTKACAPTGPRSRSARTCSA